MEIIRNENVNNYFVNGVWTINGSMKSDADATDAKKFILKVKFAGVPILDIINKSLEPTKIQWVNGQGRPNFDKWTNHQTIDIDFKSPAKAPQLTPMQQFKIDAEAAGVDITDKKALTEFIESQLDKM